MKLSTQIYSLIISFVFGGIFSLELKFFYRLYLKMIPIFKFLLSFILSSGDVLELSQEKGEVVGKVQAQGIFVDGLGVGDVGNIVIRDRQLLAENGLLIVVVTLEKYSNTIVAGPDIVSRGFVYVRESEDLMDGAKNVIKSVLLDCEEKNIKEWAYLKNNIKENLKEYLYQKTKRNPMILPIIMEV